LKLFPYMVSNFSKKADLKLSLFENMLLTPQMS
jgi:hypothetical protein